MGDVLMKYNTVSTLIEAINPHFIDVVRNYRLNNIKNEFYDEDFRDSEVNIFIEASDTGEYRYTEVMNLIKQYRRIKDHSYRCVYHEALGKIIELRKSVRNLKKLNDSRIKQVKASEQKELRSISFFLSEFNNRLSFEVDLIERCLNPFVEYVDDLKDSGMTINEDPDYILYYINKCVILSHTSFFRDDCINALSNVNKRVVGRNTYKSEMLFRLGTLDFNFHFYDEAKIIFRRTIEQLNQELNLNCTDEKKYMLFSSYLMYVTSYEFTGDYLAALAILFGLEPESKANDNICDNIIDTFDNALRKKNKKLSDLMFSTTDSNSKETVVRILDGILVDNIFQGQMAEFAYKNGFVFQNILKNSNELFESDFDSVCQGFSKKDYYPSEEQTVRVRDHFIQYEEMNKPVHDYLHILSHCLNEEATAVLATVKEGLNKNASNIAIIARALMLYVSENNDYYHNANSYKTCFATVYAEAGDFSIANASLKEYVQSDDYSKLGVDSKAEIDFYYYLISRIDSINNGRGIYVNDENDEGYNHFLNCCYRNFDFDAIAHMSLLSIEYYIATLLHQNSLVELKEIVNDDDAFSTKIRNKIKSIGNLGHNIWLSNERRKVNYMYQFLKLFLKTVNHKYIRQPQIYEIASKYLYYSNINAIVESESIPYLDYTEKDKLRESIKTIMLSYSYDEDKSSNDYYELSVGNCVYISSSLPSEELYRKLKEGISRNQGLFFVNVGMLDTQEINDDLSLECNGEETRIRLFSDEISALKEFFLFCVFERIKNDFVSPNGLFVMTPVHNAEPCKYQVTDFDELLLEVYEKIGCSEYEEEAVHVQVQYEPSCIDRRVLSKDWIRRIEPYKESIIWAATLMKRVDMTSRHTYSFCLPGKEMKTAVLLNPENCYQKLQQICKAQKVLHRTHNGYKNRCKNHFFFIGASVKSYNKRKQDRGILNKKYTLMPELHSVRSELNEIFLSMPELQWKTIQEQNPKGTLIIWEDDEVKPYVFWRLVAIKKEIHSIMDDDLPVKICNYGDDKPFQSTRRMGVSKWPKQYDVDNGENFVFISYSRTAKELIKKELNECLEKNNVRYWYSQELEVTKEWERVIADVIHKDNCVGAILFITGGEVFRSDSIVFELNEFVKKAEKNPKFSVISVVYNCDSENELEDIFQAEYDGSDDLRYNKKENVRKLLEIGRRNRQRIFLNTWNGDTLLEYEEREKSYEGKGDGALINALRSINVIK